eukprot:m.835808 g.835808  ORF g.835808 m.835808 type:complete len:56 (+) comp23455_c0_seq55:678-845(+)
MSISFTQSDIFIQEELAILLESPIYSNVGCTFLQGTLSEVLLQHNGMLTLHKCMG